MSTSIAIIAGEASGDLHGSKVVRELKQRRPDLHIFGMGGDRMVREGLEPLFHIRDFAFMGFGEVLRNLGRIRRSIRQFQAVLVERGAELLILIDYPGYNLRMAQFAKSRNIPVLYYISPQVWAWGRDRIQKIGRCVDRMAIIFEFEKDIYRDCGLRTEFVGHPILEETPPPRDRHELARSAGLHPEKRWVGLFPGSRIQEIQKILPVMIRAAQLADSQCPNLEFPVSCAPDLEPAWLKSFLPPGSGLFYIIEDDYRPLMPHCEFAMVTSGTATLETALSGLPMAVLYKTSLFSWFIGSFLIKIPDIALANIVYGRRLVPEFVQFRALPEAVARAAIEVLRNPAVAVKFRRELARVREKLGTPGASARVADMAMEMLHG